MAYVVAAAIHPLLIRPFTRLRDQITRPGPSLLNPSRRLDISRPVRLSAWPSLSVRCFVALICSTCAVLARAVRIRQWCVIRLVDPEKMSRRT